MVSSLIVNNADVSKAIIRDRRRKGHDRHDEVWDGVYIIMPDPNPEHSILVTMLCHSLLLALDPSRIRSISGGGNVSDRRTGWTRNYRCPDVLVYLERSPAVASETHWFGGPEFAVEILSPRDRAREKLGFYAKVGVQELLIVDRDPWRLELYRHDGSGLVLVGSSGLDETETVASEVLDLMFALKVGEARPQIVVTRPTDGATWLA